MNPVQTQELQRHVNTEDDGFWGNDSIRACQNHLRKICNGADEQFPRDNPAALKAFYGPPGDTIPTKILEIPFKCFYEGKPITRFSVHVKLHESLAAIYAELNKLLKKNEDRYHGIRYWSGCYNNRPKTGGKNPSLHAYAAAIDLDAQFNAYKSSWPLKASMPIEVMEAFAKYGWLSAGAFWGYDAMHFQATRWPQ